MFATTTPLDDVKIVALKNVLASQQEIILDIVVSAQNPNVVSITVDSMNMDVFAKSKYLDPDYEWWKQPSMARSMRRATRGSNIQIRDDDPNDPPLDEDPEAAQTIKLGRIIEFDSPLMFDGSPFQHVHSTSVGEVRLAKPGNQTDSGGSEQWQRAVQHEFDLILRGVLKYSLPLSNRVRSVEVHGRTTVKGNQADDPDKLHII